MALLTTRRLIIAEARGRNAQKYDAVGRLNSACSVPQESEFLLGGPQPTIVSAMHS
jgi:hypothetical protein